MGRVTLDSQLVQPPPLRACVMLDGACASAYIAWLNIFTSGSTPSGGLRRSCIMEENSLSEPNA